METVLINSFNVPTAAGSHKKNLSGTVVLSDAIEGTSFVFTPTVDCFIRAGVSGAVDPTAVADGTDMFVFGNNMYRVTDWVPGTKLALITNGVIGIVYVSPYA